MCFVTPSPTSIEVCYQVVFKYRAEKNCSLYVSFVPCWEFYLMVNPLQIDGYHAFLAQKRNPPDNQSSYAICFIGEPALEKKPERYRHRMAAAYVIGWLHQRLYVKFLTEIHFKLWALQTPREILHQQISFFTIAIPCLNFDIRHKNL